MNNSSPSPPAPLGRFDRPLPPLPKSSSSPTLKDDGSEHLVELQRPLHAEQTLNFQPQYGVAEGGHIGTTADSNYAWRSRDSSSVNFSRSRSASAAEEDVSLHSRAFPSNEDSHPVDDSNLLFRTSSVHGSRAPRNLTLSDNTGPFNPRSRSHSQTLAQALQTPSATRTSSSGSDSEGSYRDRPLLSHTSPGGARRRQRQEPEAESAPAEFVVPRWQPDAEVTMCPICRTQFSFFIRKHHCRKCGRVVCNSCSPHRITIPYQYIVQQPSEGASSGSGIRPSFGAQRDGGSLVRAGSLGGGERVRLCNPCVPDPNTAPPQSPAPHLHQPSHRQHNRSASTATGSFNSPGNYRSRDEVERLISKFPQRPREPGIPGNNVVSPGNVGLGVSRNEREDRNLQPSQPESRSRSSTVGHSRDSGQSSSAGNLSPRRSHQPYQSLIPRMQSSSNSQVELPRQARPRIAEEDECWVCHRELPSRMLPSFEQLREAHVEACIAAATKGSLSSPTPSMTTTRLPPRTSESSNSASPAQASSSSNSVPVPIANTREARTAAREQAHAAVIWAASHPSSPGPLRRTGLFPYQATEKDCVDDAECTICLEEFVIGVEMGRLECFCRFHLHCIRQWFENHPGQCPVHQHGAGF